ncbi:hypothetical protein F5877DRAFT_85292 [Lentinula edodes]|nr:hypothetical protein F5877DRAFT_85292 [Lentinula edodes]
MPPTLRSQSKSVRDDQESVSTDLPDILDLVRDIHAQRTRRRSSTPVPGPSAPATGRLSPPRTNGEVMPPKQYIVNGTTLGLYFGRTRALTQVVRFKSKNTSKGAPPDTIFKRRTDFSKPLWLSIVVVISLVGPTTKPGGTETWRSHLPDATKSIRVTFGITFFAIHEPERFVESLPRCKSEDGRRDIICRILTVFAINVRNHVEHGVPYKSLLRG